MKMERPQLSMASIAPLLPLLAVVCALLALWFGWSGWQQYQDGTRRDAILQSRDGALKAIGDSLTAERQRFDQQLANPVLRAAIAGGDFARAGALLSDGWPGASDGTVLAPTLDSAYAALPEGGFGRLGVLEAAVASDATVARVVDTA
ncbi:hypothetical protein ACKVMH_13460, partial [Lysobacter zhanggongensis]